MKCQGFICNSATVAEVRANPSCFSCYLWQWKWKWLFYPLARDSPCEWWQTRAQVSTTGWVKSQARA